MSLFKETFTTIRVFTVIFVIGGGVIGFVDLYQAITAGLFNAFWGPVTLVMSSLYVIGGVYFVVNIHKLLPRYRVTVLKVIIGMFCIELLLGAINIVQMMRDPSLLGPELVNDPDALYFILLSSLAGALFNFLVYAVLYHAINTVSGVERKKPRAAITVAAWILVLLLVGGAIIGFGAN